MSKQSDVADAIGGILAQIHRTPPLDCDRSRVDALLARIPRPPRGRSGAVDQVTLAMAGSIRVSILPSHADLQREPFSPRTPLIPGPSPRSEGRKENAQLSSEPPLLSPPGRVPTKWVAVGGEGRRWL